MAIRLFCQALIALMTLLVSCAAADQSDDTLVWTFANNTEYDLQIVFYFTHDTLSDHYVLEAGKSQNYPVSCRVHQLICYGAWLAHEEDEDDFEDGHEPTWGVGVPHSGPKNLNGACYRCGDGQVSTDLDPI